jgi:predicted dehydrogenase
MRLRGAVFGCGMISEYHLRAWSRVPEVEIVALGNRTIARAEQRRREFAPEARVYGDLPAMLAHERLDFIDILTAPALHRDHCLLAREAGLHIICQKPLCDTYADARALVREMRGYPKVFVVHENHRYRPWFHTVLERLGAGFFGRIRLVRFEELRATAPQERYKQEAGHGVLLEYGSHLVDMMRSLLGEPDRVYARMHRLHPGVSGESLAHVVYQYPEATAVVEVAWKSAVMDQAGTLVVGDQGEAWYEGVLARGASSRLRLSQGGQVIHDETRRVMDDYAESFYLLERECVDAMLTGSPVIQTGPEHLKTLAATFAAYESARRGGPVDIAEFAGAAARS